MKTWYSMLQVQHCTILKATILGHHINIYIESLQNKWQIHTLSLYQIFQFTHKCYKKKTFSRKK